MLLPAATAMGATFDIPLMKEVGKTIAQEAKERNIQVVLGPTVCLQRSPLLGRGFEAFGEDPILSGLMGSAYINGMQDNGVAACIKHYAAHDQSEMSPEDDVRASERTLRELHFLPFQLAVKYSKPWSLMSSYHMINGVHTPENEWMMETVLRKEWGWKGLIMSDWFGVFSTSESLNAGLDLEMPGPTRWRGALVQWALMSKKVTEKTLNDRVTNVLELIDKVKPILGQKHIQHGDTEEKRRLCRKVASESIVLLKNEKGILPLSKTSNTTFGLIGPAVHNPALGGGGSADLKSYYRTTPYASIRKLLGGAEIQSAIGCYSKCIVHLLDRC
jgi:beta-glucosidase